MTAQSVYHLHTESEAHESWLPMIAIALGQVLMSFNVASLPVAIGGMVASFDVAPTTVATAIVMYSLAVAGLVMLGAKLNQRFGALRVFRGVVLIFGVAMAMMTFSPNACALGATRRGMLPNPISPRVWPSSRRIGTTAGISQRPDCTSVLDNGIFRARASSSAMAWSDTSFMQ